VYASLVARGEALYGFDYRGYWRDLGTAASLAAARADLSGATFRPSYLKSY